MRPEGATRPRPDVPTQATQPRPHTAGPASGHGGSYDLQLQASAGTLAVQALVGKHRPNRPPMVQRFGSREHQELGDDGSGGLAYHMGPDGARTANFVEAKPFRLTHGDIVMLSGDYFDPRDTIQVGTSTQSNQESLFKLAGTPSTDPGKQLGTQDEVIYAIKEAVSTDPRFAPAAGGRPAGEWADIVFSDEVKDTVHKRYLRRAADNREHFASPTGTEGGPASGNRASAGGSFRALHEDAILRAFYAGQTNGDIAEAQAREAAAQHYLTDNFAAGHVRTPRQSMKDYWRKKYPLFWGNLQKKIALDVARYMNDNETNLATVGGTVSVLYDNAMEIVETKVKGLPELGFGDLVSGVAHDVDNRTGLWVVNDIGDRWKTFGDSNLHNPDADNKTPQMAEQAVRLGLDDIQHAFSLGAANRGPILDDWVLRTVRGQASSPATAGDKYAPEQALPHLDPTKDNGTQAWQVADLDALWGTQVRTDGAATYGTEISASLKQPDGEFRKQLEDLAKTIDAERPVGKWLGIAWAGTLHPRAAFRNGFMAPLIADPLSGLRAIIDYNPSEGQAWFNEDDAAREESAKMSKDEFEGFTLNQRADRIKALISGTFNYVGKDDGELVIKLFETAKTPGDRPQLYRLVEGHAWTGDWIEGWFVDDDELYNSLNKGQLARLRKLINEVVPAPVPAGAH
jgi:hypothetical protein